MQTDYKLQALEIWGRLEKEITAIIELAAAHNRDGHKEPKAVEDAYEHVQAARTALAAYADLPPDYKHEPLKGTSLTSSPEAASSPDPASSPNSKE